MELKPQRVRGTTPLPKQCSAVPASMDEVLRSFIGPKAADGAQHSLPYSLRRPTRWLRRPAKVRSSFLYSLFTNRHSSNRVITILPTDNLQPLLIPLSERSLPAEKIPRTITRRPSTNGSRLPRFSAAFLWHFFFLKHDSQCTPAYDRVSIYATRVQRSRSL